MNQMQSVATSPNPDEANREFNILDFMIVLARHKKLIIWLPVIVGIVAGAISFAMPNVYKAGTKLLPPQQAQSGAAALLSQLGGAASLAGAAAGLKNPSDVYIGMLKSRTTADRLIAGFNLQKVYGEDTLEQTRKVLEANSAINAGKDGLITIEVEDEDRKRAAQLANGYVAELIKLNKVLAVTEASQRRLFFERQLELAKDNLANAEMRLKGSLDTRGVISVDAESRAVVETVGRLRAQISAKEIQLSSMQAFVTANNPEYKRTQEELSSLRAELSRLENGRPGNEAESGAASGAGAGRQAGLENIKVLRDVKYYQMLYELLAKQYEVARLDEAKDTAIIQVLDPAVEPERKSKPKRAIIVVLSAVLAFFAAVAWAFVLETKNKVLAAPEGAQQWKELKTLVRAKR